MTDLIESLTPAPNPADSPCASGELLAFERLGNDGEDAREQSCDVDEASFEQCSCDMEPATANSHAIYYVCPLHKGLGHE